jgi:hypothetical protein
MKHIAILFPLAALAGCASATTMPLSNDTVQIMSGVAPICGQEGAQKVAVRQASVETIKRGYDRFMIVDAAARSDVGVVGYTPVVANTTGYATATGYGNTATAYGSSTTTYFGRLSDCGRPSSAGPHREDVQRWRPGRQQRDFGTRRVGAEVEGDSTERDGDVPRLKRANAFSEEQY